MKCLIFIHLMFHTCNKDLIRQHTQKIHTHTHTHTPTQTRTCKNLDCGNVRHLDSQLEQTKNESYST